MSAIGSITAPDKMCAPTSEPFSSTHDRNVAPGDGRQLLQADRGAQPGRAGADQRPRHIASIRVGSSSSRRGGTTIRTRLHCPFLDRGVNDGEEKWWVGIWNEIGVAEARSALAWWLEAGVDVAVQEDARAWLRPLPRVCSGPRQSRQRANVAGPSRGDPRRPPILARKQRQPAARRRRRRGGSPPTDRKMPRSCCSATGRRLKMRPPESHRWSRLGPGPADARGHRHFRRRCLQCLARLLPRTRARG